MCIYITGLSRLPSALTAALGPGWWETKRVKMRGSAVGKGRALFMLLTSETLAPELQAVAQATWRVVEKGLFRPGRCKMLYFKIAGVIVLPYCFDSLNSPGFPRNDAREQAVFFRLTLFFPSFPSPCASCPAPNKPRPGLDTGGCGQSFCPLACPSPSSQAWTVGSTLVSSCLTVPSSPVFRTSPVSRRCFLLQHPGRQPAAPTVLSLIYHFPVTYSSPPVGGVFLFFSFFLSLFVLPLNKNGGPLALVGDIS